MNDILDPAEFDALMSKPAEAAQAGGDRYDFAGQDYAQADADVEWLETMVSTLRRVRSELNVSPGKTVRLLLQDGAAQDRARIERILWAQTDFFLVRQIAQNIVKITIHNVRKTFGIDVIEHQAQHTARLHQLP